MIIISGKELQPGQTYHGLYHARNGDFPCQPFNVVRTATAQEMIDYMTNEEGMPPDERALRVMRRTDVYFYEVVVD